MHTLHLPFVSRPPAIVQPGQPGAQFLAPDERLAEYLVQVRPHLVRDGRLDRAAQAQANFLAYRQLVLNDPLPSMHIGADGTYANDRARREGYDLPDSYPAGVNYIESIAVTHLGPDHAWELFMGSQSHREHVTGAGWFFSTQTVYGVGVEARWYVVLIAPPEA